LFFGIDISKKQKEQSERKKKWVKVNVFSGIKPNASGAVLSYLAHPFKISLARDVSHYEQDKIEQVFRRNHLAAGVYEFSILVILLSTWAF
jgi:hypothetical protein